MRVNGTLLTVVNASLSMPHKCLCWRKIRPHLSFLNLSAIIFNVMLSAMQLITNVGFFWLVSFLLFFVVSIVRKLIAKYDITMLTFLHCFWACFWVFSEMYAQSILHINPKFLACSFVPSYTLIQFPTKCGYCVLLCL